MVSGIETALFQPLQVADLRTVSRQVEADVRTQLSRLEPGAIVDFQYSVGPNGELVASQATVTGQNETTAPLARPAAAPTSFAEIQGPQIGISPQDEVDAFGLTADEREQIRELQSRDIEVRNHEAQHLRAAGGLAVGTPNYSYEVGPDGRYYAVGGHVNVATSATTDPEQQAREAQTLAIAASAPADASAQDNSVARRALSGIDITA